VYVAVFGAHFSLLSKDCVQDCGSILGGENTTEEVFDLYNSVPRGNLIEKFVHDHRYMIGAGGGGFQHESQMPSWQLPFQWNSDLVYVSEEYKGKTVIVVLKENILSSAVGLIGVLGALYLAARAYAKNKWHLAMPSKQYNGLLFLLLGYAIFFGLFGALFHSLMLYHYFTALIFSFMMFAVVFEQILCRLSTKKQRLLLALFLCAVVGGFVWGSPYTYGFTFSLL